MKRFPVASLLLAIACRSPTPAEQMDAIASWVGTATVAGEAWLRHTTPDKYTRQTLELSNRTLVQIADDLFSSPLPPAVDSAGLDSVISRSSSHIAQMARLVEQNNSSGFTKQLDSLRLDQQLVTRLSETIKSSQ